MLVEKIIFVILSVYLLIMMFFKFIKKLDKIYISILLLELFGIILGLVEIIFTLNLGLFVKIIMYLISIIIPIIIVLLERKGKNLAEYVYIFLAKIYEIMRKK